MGLRRVGKNGQEEDVGRVHESRTEFQGGPRLAYCEAAGGGAVKYFVWTAGERGREVIGGGRGAVRGGLGTSWWRRRGALGEARWVREACSGGALFGEE